MTSNLFSLIEDKRPKLAGIWKIMAQIKMECKSEKCLCCDHFCHFFLISRVLEHSLPKLASNFDPFYTPYNVSG